MSKLVVVIIVVFQVTVMHSISPLYRTSSNTSSCHLQLNEHSCILNSEFLKPVTLTPTEEQTFQLHCVENEKGSTDLKAHFHTTKVNTYTQGATY